MKITINEESLFQRAMARRLQKRNRKIMPADGDADDAVEVDDEDVVSTMSTDEDRLRMAYAINWLEQTLEYKAWRGVLFDMAKDIIEDALDQAGANSKGGLASDNLKNDAVKTTAKKVYEKFTSAMNKNLPEDAREFLRMNESLEKYVYKQCLVETKRVMKNIHKYKGATK